MVNRDKWTNKQTAAAYLLIAADIEVLRICLNCASESSHSCASRSSRWHRTSLSISEPCTRSCALIPPCGVFLPGTIMAETPWWIHPKPSCSTEQISSLGWAGCCWRRCGMNWKSNGPRPSGTTGCVNRSSARAAPAFGLKSPGLSPLAGKASV